LRAAERLGVTRFTKPSQVRNDKVLLMTVTYDSDL
jgi:hypothetical protein